jgi:hypothetical protein
MADLTENKTAVITDGVADFETIDGSFVKSLVVEIEPSQSGTGTPSPSNIRPITGWTREDVTVVGKNRFNPSTITLNTIINNDGSLTSNNFINTSDYIIINEQTFTVLNNSTANDVYFRAGMYDANYNFVRREASPVMSSEASYTFSNVTGIKYVRISYEKSSNNEIQVELGSSATAYEPYKGKTYTTPFNQTVYGGTLDVLTGELTIDKAIVDLGTLTWGEGTDTTGQYFVVSLSGAKGTTSVSIVADAVCSNYPVFPSNNVVDKSLAIGSTTPPNVYVRDTSYTSASAFKTAMNGVQLVYELATPTTIQLTPQKVKSLVGENHISASTGDVTECRFSMLINGDDLEMLLS